MRVKGLETLVWLTWFLLRAALLLLRAATSLAEIYQLKNIASVMRLSECSLLPVGTELRTVALGAHFAENHPEIFFRKSKSLQIDAKPERTDRVQ